MRCLWLKTTNLVLAQAAGLSSDPIVQWSVRCMPADRSVPTAWFAGQVRSEIACCRPEKQVTDVPRLFFIGQHDVPAELQLAVCWRQRIISFTCMQGVLSLLVILPAADKSLLHVKKQS